MLSHCQTEAIEEGGEQGAYLADSYPAHVTKEPTTHSMRLIPLLPVAAKTTPGLTKIPLPIVLFRIKALFLSVFAVFLTLQRKRPGNLGYC